MNSLQELNNYGSSSLTVTDSRYAGIKYTPASPAPPFTQILNIASTTVTVNAGIDITEIINYSTANVRYRVTIVPGNVTPLTGSSISWASLPTGVSLTTVGNVYTLSGINSVAQWQAIKSFTWTLPGNYASKPFWYLQVSVVYYDEELGADRTVDWEAYDEDFYYVAELNSTASLTCDALDVILGSASITGAFTPSLNFIRVKSGFCNLLCETSATAEGQINADNLSAVTSMPTARLTFTLGNIKGNLTAVNSINCNGVIAISNMFDRTYTANNENLLFATNTPQIEDATPSGATFSITFSSSLGTFSNSSTVASSSPFTYSGTLEQVNAVFASIRFYPTAGSTANGSFTYTQQKNAVTQVTRTVNLTGSAGTYSAQTYTFTSSQLWTPSNADLLYKSSVDVLLVGGGGGGAYSGGGGGGGVYDVIGASLTSQNYSIIIGNGGTVAVQHATVAQGGTPGKAANGGNTSAFGYTATGGGGGYDDGYPSFDGNGGNSGVPAYDISTSYAGATGAGSGTGLVGGGGGGAGGIGVGSPSRYSNGGFGKKSQITNLYYGGGGGGYRGSFIGYGGNGTTYSRTAKTLTTTGNASIDVITKKYGNGSLYLDGTTGYVKTTTTHSDFNFYPLPFTIEMWVYRTRTNQKEFLIDFRTSLSIGGPVIYFDYDGGKNYISWGAESEGISSNRYEITNWTSQWHHICLYVDPVNLQTHFFVDGVNVNTNGMTSLAIIDRPLTIGANYANNQKFQGYIDDIRVNGNQIYSTSGFLTPTEELLNLPNTVFLLNANTVIADNVSNFQDNAGGANSFDNPTVGNGEANTGGGGGGGAQYTVYGEGAGNGGSGLVVVRFNA